MQHAHELSGWTVFEAAAAFMLLAAAAAYGAGLLASRHRGRWPAHRTLCFYAGLACAAAGVTGPVAAAAHESFTAHMAGHLLLGMAAPLLLVLAAPATLALRALPVDQARILTRLLGTAPVRFLTRPVAAVVLNAGGVWILYTTGLYPLMGTSPPLHALVHAHLFLAGYLLTASVAGVDPDPHRASTAVRSTVLILFIAAHSILAKWLYAHPPAGVGAADARAGAQLMYYGGDAVDVALIVLLFAGWYRATRPRQASQAGAPGSKR